MVAVTIDHPTEKSQEPSTTPRRAKAPVESVMIKFLSLELRKIRSPSSCKVIILNGCANLHRSRSGFAVRDSAMAILLISQKASL